MTDKDKVILRKVIGYIDDAYDYRQGLDFESFFAG